MSEVVTESRPAPELPEPMLDVRTARLVLELLDQVRARVEDDEYDVAAEIAQSTCALTRNGPTALNRATYKLVEALEWGEEDDDEACCARCGATCVACSMDGEDPKPMLQTTKKLATEELARVERALYRPLKDAQSN